MEKHLPALYLLIMHKKTLQIIITHGKTFTSTVSVNNA